TFVDSPVLGSIREVESGRLVIFFGGPAETFAHSVPLLEALGRPIHVGDRGSGAAAKLVANSTLITAITALGEAIRLGDGLGLERATTFEVLAATAFAQQAERRRPLIESGDYPPRFTLALADKDARLVLETGVELPVTAAAERWLAAALHAGLGDADYSVVISVILDAAARPEVASDT